MSVIAAVTDIMFSSRIFAEGRAVGVEIKPARTLDKLREKLAAGGAQLVIIDLGAEGLDALQAIDICRQHSPSPRVVAFASHVQGEMIAAARKAGADEVLARSAFVGRLPLLLSQLGSAPTTHHHT
jgi:DNA-binding NarL/FixJ family response regulator